MLDTHCEKVIDIRELRIGNYLLNENKIVRVSIISLGLREEDQNVIVFCYLDNLSHEYYGTGAHAIDKLRPIPLTPEWLNFSGYPGIEQRDGSSDFFELPRGNRGVANWLQYDSGRQLCFHHGGYVRGVSIQYVHQLQNLYYIIVGEELNIK